MSPRTLFTCKITNFDPAQLELWLCSMISKAPDLNRPKMALEDKKDGLHRDREIEIIPEWVW